MAETVTLRKGQNVNLSKAAGPAGLNKVLVGLGWDARTTTGSPLDLDSMAVAVGDNKQVPGGNPDWFVFYSSKLRTKDKATTYAGGYGNGLPASPDAAIVHNGDNTTGTGAGDDEVIDIDLAKLPPSVVNVKLVVAIFPGEHGETANETFGTVEGAFIRIVNAETSEELARFDLTEDAALNKIMIFGEMYRDSGNPNEWKFKAIEAGWDEGDLESLLNRFGVTVEH